MAEIDVFYINLDSAIERRRALEQSFADSRFSPAWALTRFEAIQGSSPLVEAKPGKTSPSLKGAWLSHVGCAKAALERGLTSHLLVVEDDTEFCAATEFWATGATRFLPPKAWDVLYLDAFLTDALDLPWFFKLRHRCFKENRIEVIPLLAYARPWAGASAYLINKASLEKFVALTDLDSLDVAYDIHLRRLIRYGQLRGALLFPFLTRPAAGADVSQVQEDSDRVREDALLNDFRRLTWIGGGAPSDERSAGEAVVTKDVRAFEQIFTPLLTRQLAWF